MRRLFIFLIFSALACATAYSQVSRTEISVDFRLNRSDIDREYMDNAQRLVEIVDFFNKVKQDTSVTILEVAFCGSASPEGSYQINKRLAGNRLAALEALVRSEIDIPDSLVTRNDSYISWDYLTEQISATDIQYKEEILEIISHEPEMIEYPDGRILDSRIVELQAIEGGKVWQALNSLYFAHMRNAYVVFMLYKDEYEAEVDDLMPADDAIDVELDVIQIDTLAVPKQPEPMPEPEPEPEPMPEPVVIPEIVNPFPNIYVKSNAIGLLLSNVNAAVEMDVAPHWSVTLPVYYSAINYFIPTLMFRTFSVQPEARFWLKEHNQGFFVGAHLGLSYYNFAFNGDLRYQDHKGKSPALGGGLSAGYRLPISADQRWFIEFSLGAGVYGLHYDTFYNVNNGKLVDTYRWTYVGLDNTAVTIAYRFDYKPRKR